MSVLRQLNVLGQMRLDVPHIRSIESSIAADFDVVVGRGWAGDRGLIVRGFTLSNVGVGTTAAEIILLAADSIVYNVNASESGSFLWVPPDRAPELLNTSNPKVSGSFTASTVNYIGIDFKRESDDSTTDLVQFLDANTLLENGRNVPLGRTLDYTILISSAPFSTTPNIVPVAKVTTDANNKIASIQDARAMMYRLGSGGDNPNPQFAYTYPFGRQENSVTNKFTGGDKNILSNKDWMDSVMTRLWELGGGENWYSPTHPKNIRVTRKAFPDVFSNGENFELIGIHVHWRGLGVLFENANTPGVYYNEIADQLTDDVLTLQTQLNAGDCLYVDIDFTANRSGPTALQMRKAPLQSLGTPTIPGSRLVIAWRSNNTGSIDIYSRDYPYLINVTIEPATTTSVGGVRLNQAAITPSTPTVLTLGSNNVFRAGQAPHTPAGFEPAIEVVQSGAGMGIRSTGGTGNTAGVIGIGGAGGPDSGIGIYGDAGVDGGTGVFGQGRGNGAGVSGIAQNTAPGVSGEGGAGGGRGGTFAGNGTGYGVYGQGGSGGGHGVFGLAGTAGSVAGVFGNGLGNGRGVWGQGDTGVSPNSGTGVFGDGGTPDGVGVAGNGKGAGAGGSFISLGTGPGVAGTGGTGAAGVAGTGGSGGIGVTGQGTGTSQAGVRGTGSTAGTNATGVIGNGGTAGGHGVVGNGSTAAFGYGVLGIGGATGSGVVGVPTIINGFGVQGETPSNGTGAGVVGYAVGNGSGGVGVQGFSQGALNAAAVAGTSAAGAPAFSGLSIGGKGAVITSSLTGVEATCAGSSPGGIFTSTSGSRGVEISTNNYYGHTGNVSRALHYGVEHFNQRNIGTTTIVVNARSGHEWRSSDSGVGSIAGNIHVPAGATITDVQLLLENTHVSNAYAAEVRLTKHEFGAAAYLQTNIDNNPSSHSQAASTFSWVGATYNSTTLGVDVQGISEGKLYMTIQLPQTAVFANLILWGVRILYTMRDFHPTF